MKRLLKRLSALVAVGALAGTTLVVAAVVPSSATDTTIPVNSRVEALEGTVWVDGIPDPLSCMVTDLGTHTQPEVFHAAETETRSAYKQVTLGQSEVSHVEYKYQREVADYKTQYHFSKFTREQTREWVKGTPDQKASYVKWVWTGGKTSTAPTFPGDKWNKTNDTRPNKHDPLNQVYKTGNGSNASWAIYVETSPAIPGTPSGWGPWSDFGPWTQWKPVQHTSWEDSDAPLGSPVRHGGSKDDHSGYYREWQARFDGQTRQVSNGSHTETTDWVTSVPAGDGWVQIDSKPVVDSEATPDVTVYFSATGEPTSDLTNANYTTVAPGEPWVLVDSKSFTVREAYTDPEVVTNYSHTYVSPDCTIPVQPADKTGEDISYGDQVCVDPSDGWAERTKTVTPWTQAYVWSDEAGAYVLGEKVLGDPITTTEPVDAPDCAPSEPPVKAPTYTEWVVGEFACGDTAVEQTRTRTDYSFEWNQDEHRWVETATDTVEMETRALTPDEIASLECLVIPEDSYNCSDFSYQEDAQAVYDQTMAEYGFDVHRLDGNNDGIACNSLPGKPVGPVVPEKPEDRTGVEIVISEPVCVLPLNGTATITTTTTAWTETSTYDEASNSWVYGERVFGEPVVTTEVVDSVECAPVVVPPTVSCADFEYQEDAQAAFDSDPIRYAELDGDGDGVACESLPSKPVEPTPTPEPTEEPTPTPTPEPSPTEPVNPAPTETPEPSPSETPAPVVTGKATAPAPALAETGVDGSVLQVVGGIALILLAVGAGIFFYRRKGAGE